MSEMGQSLPMHSAPASNNVRCYSNSGQTRVRLNCPLCAKNGLMHRSNQRLYSITSSARASSVGGHTRDCETLYVSRSLGTLRCFSKASKRDLKVRDITKPRTFAAWPYFDEEMIQAAIRVFQSGQVNYWTGSEGLNFEVEAATAVGTRYSLAVTNGTAALELALRSLGIGPGDDVITTPRSFIASASCVVNCGGRPVFADVARDSGTIVAETIEAVLTPNTRAIVLVHLGGWPCDLEPILEVAVRHDIKVIEDVAQAMGGTYRGKGLGSFGDAAAFSFCADKIVSTGGEGGLLVTSQEATFKRAWGLRDHGQDWDAVHAQQESPGYKWTRSEFGSNHRMTEIQAAIGRVALRRLPGWLSIRRRNSQILSARLADVGALRIPPPPAGHAFYRLYTYVRRDRLKNGWTRDSILAELLRRGLPCSVGTCGELYLEKAFQSRGLSPPTRLPVARELGETSIAFFVHPTLTENDVHQIADTVHSVMQEAMS